MKDPGRLFDETDSEMERLLLGVGRSEKSSSEARVKTLAALGLTGSAAIAATGTAVAASSTAPVAALGKVTWAKVVVGLSALGAVVAAPPAYRAWHRHATAPHAAIALSMPAAPPVTAHPPAPEAQALAPQLTNGDHQAAPTPTRRSLSARASTAHASTAHASAARVAAGPVPLTRELGALDAIRAALARDEAPRALSLLDTYARRYPQGRLALEAEILRIDALAKSGRSEEARQTATAFLHRHPNSVLAARARRYLDD